MASITPFLWYDTQAEDAARFYCGIFPDSGVDRVMKGPDGKAFGLEFHLGGQSFMALNGGPMYKFTPAISLYVNCKDQKEVDTLWAKLSAVPKAEQCGWIVDKYGLSWQIIPEALPRLLGDKDPAKAGRAMQAMMQMKKIDVKALERAAAGK
ncbi:MAG: VOC family protein [bacterium]